jgi:5-formyltetrahydrofolate cyclo-ligase
MTRSDAVRKDAVRAPLLQARRRRDDASRATVAEALAAHLLALPSVARASRVAAYRSMADEPGTGPFLDGLVARGTEVLLPVTLDDGGLAWVRHDPAAPTSRSRLGVEETVGPRLGPDALADADVVVVPALAADHRGRRLGRGAGYYDRALAALPHPRRPLLVALVHADELLPEVPHEPHDVPVDVVVTENGVFRVPQHP